ncbi:CDP-alcohol phosphatidyltransferase family protein [Modestobacter sp. SSW1-42]|uniref:CDP-alcohol phosphatidyltransferase family protein n=1 Tax=Modestobacter sp. SSW1-42 TaxID=596372 RepID=UPI0039881102
MLDTSRPGAPGVGEETFRTTVRRLESAQKGATGAPAYSRFVNRRLGRLLAAAAFHAGLTPNAVTGLSAACTGAGIVALALVPPSLSAGLLVAGLLVLGYALDSADGQLARLRGGGSPAGEWLDHMVDSLKIASLHLALLVGLYRFEPVERGPWLLVPLGFSVVSVVLFFGTLLNESLRAQHGVPTRAARTAGRPSVLRSLVVAPTDYGVLCLAFALLGAPVVFLTVYGALAVATAGYLGLAVVKWYAEMEGMPA